MCGIVGFIGNKQASQILIDGLSKLEYRGYDSAGIAVRNNEEDIAVVKAKGRLKALIEKTDNIVPASLYRFFFVKTERDILFKWESTENL